MNFVYNISPVQLDIRKLHTLDKVLREAKLDLNGDGKKDQVEIHITKDTSEFVLSVNQIKVKAFLGNSRDDSDYEADGFDIVDIDTADKFKEIAVHAPGISSDDLFLVYSYDGKSLKKMALLSRWPTFLGNGVVLEDGWMGWWRIRNEYILNQLIRTLQLIPQELYYVGVEGKVSTTFPLYTTKKKARSIARLKPQNKITILLYDFCHKGDGPQRNWYLVKSEHGLVDWASENDIETKIGGLPWAD